MRLLLTDQMAVNMPEHLFLSWQQAGIAIKCLSEKYEKIKALQADASNVNSRPSHEILPYLIHASVLFFTIRDLVAFEVIRQEDAFRQSPLPQKIRQVPSYQQLMALLNSVAKTQPLLHLIQPISNNALPLESLQNFRNAVIQQGVPPEISESSSLKDNPEPAYNLPSFDYFQLTEQLLASWQLMVTWALEKTVFGKQAGL